MELKREITCINKKFVIFSLNVFLILEKYDCVVGG